MNGKQLDLSELQFPANHQEIVNRFIEACRDDDRIVAAFIGGSYASGTTDKYSDLDLMFITTDEAYEDFLLERVRFARLLGEPLFLESFGQPNGYCIIYANLAECDLWFGSESSFQNLNSGPYLVLVDKKGILEGYVFPFQPADQEKQIKVLRQQLDWFWHDLSHFIKAMGRGQLWFAYGELEILRQVCVNLARLQHDFADPYVGDEPYFKVEQALPVERLAPLQATCCEMEYGAMLQAALVIFNFYRDVGRSLSEAHDVTYQVDLETQMFTQLQGLGDF